MPISKFPELQGALFPSDGAMELAEKRVLTKRAAKERQEEAARQQQAQEEQARAEKAARIEAKRKESEQRLQEAARKRAADVEAEADRVRQNLIQQKAQAQQQAAAAKEQEQRSKEAAKRQAVKEEAERQAVEQERIRRVQQEKDRKREERIKRKQQEERDADIRWLKQQMEHGKVTVGKRKNHTAMEYYVKSSSVSDAKPGDVLDWATKDSDLPSTIKIHVDVDPAEQEATMARRTSLSTNPGGSKGGSPPKVRSSDKQWTRGATNYLQTAVDEFDPKQPMAVLRNKMLGLVEKLADPEDKFEAVLVLHTYLTRLYAESGRQGVLKAARQAKTGQAISESPRRLAQIMRESPGNVYALSILGLQRFVGDDDLQDTVAALNIIPDDPDCWLGQMIGSRLFFDFVLWRQDGSPPRTGWTELEFAPQSSAFGSESMLASAQAKVTELIAALNLPEARVKDMATIMSGYDERVQGYLEFQKELKQTVSAIEISAPGAAKEEDNPQLGPDLADAQSQLNAALGELRRAQGELEAQRQQLMTKENERARLEMLLAQEAD